MQKRKAKRIVRKCVICGTIMRIKVSANRTYDKGHYFGKMKMQVRGTGKWVKIGKFKEGGLDGNVVKWAGKEKGFEYWECGKCFNEDRI